jgi:hypothetical protein
MNLSFFPALEGISTQLLLHDYMFVCLSLLVSKFFPTILIFSHNFTKHINIVTDKFATHLTLVCVAYSSPLLL